VFNAGQEIVTSEVFDEEVLMQIATVGVDDLEKSRKVTTRLLLDTASQKTYITKQLKFVHAGGISDNVKYSGTSI